MTSTIPSPVEISKELHLQLLKENEELGAIQRTMQMFAETCERRIAAHHENVRKIWMKISKETGVDIENVSWQPNPRKNEIVPIGMNFPQARLSPFDPLRKT